MKISFVTVFVSLLGVLFLTGTVSHAQITLPRNMEISCESPNPDAQTKLRRPRGDGNWWHFNLILKDGAQFAEDAKPDWVFPAGEGANLDWGTWTGGDGTATLSWSAPLKSGPFTVTVTGKITCGGNGNGDAINFSATWSGEIIECDEPTDLTEEDINISKVGPNFTALQKLSSEDLYGLTWPQLLKIPIIACLGEDNRWHARVLSITGEYSIQIRLRPNVLEVTGPPPSGNATNLKYCKQVFDLRVFGMDTEEGGVETKAEWYMKSAVVAHEQVHSQHLLPTLKAIASDIKTSIEEISIPDETGMTREQAINAIKDSEDYFDRVSAAQGDWFSKMLAAVSLDHGNYAGPAYVAEAALTTPMWQSICAYAKAHSWDNCNVCN